MRLFDRDTTSFRALVLFAGTCALVTAQDPGYDLPTAVRRVAEAITADRLEASLTFLASDELEGRATPSRGLDIAAKYLASRLAEIGVTPAGDAGSYFQRIDLLHLVVDPGRSFVNIGGKRFTFPDGFGAGMNWLHRTAGSARGPLVYVGDGLGEDRFSGVTLSNKIVVISLRTSRTREELIAARVAPQEAYVRQHGACGIIWLEDDRRFASWERERLARETRPGLSLQDSEVPYSRRDEALPSIVAGKDLMEAIFEGEKFSAREIIARGNAGNPVPAFDLRKEVDFSLAVKPRVTARTQNVIAVLEGSDSALKHEFVVIGAHYDGVPQPGWGCYSYWQFQSQSYPGQVFHNAYDNGSGTVAVLNIVEAMIKAPRPRRSVLFVFFTGEECGGVGSRYFTHLPTVPLSSIVGFLNFDSVGADQGPKYANVEIEIAGTRRHSEDLWKLSKSVNDAYLNMKAVFGEDDGGDARAFRLKEIPFLYFQNGEGSRMHIPSDTVDKIDFRKLEQITRTGYAITWTVANAAQRPRVAQ